MAGQSPAAEDATFDASSGPTASLASAAVCSVALPLPEILL
jgi:hypothetical protein